ncbi:MAG TPA: ribosome-associated translation inhibitor RaiA [Caulobacteraceae bacterium]|jgi:ribosomal subunit interface protein
MQVQVTGKQLDVGDALRSRISDELTNSIGKFFDRGGDAEVVVSQDGKDFRIDCRVVLASGQFLESHGFAGDAHSAFDAALAKIETRVRRYKRRLKNHHGGGSPTEAENAAYTVLRAPSEEDEDDGWELPDGADGNGHAPPTAMVVAETAKPVRTQTVAMAVLELDLADAQVIVFRNAAHGGISVVYRRADGNIGWIDPERNGRGNGAQN